MSTQPTDRPTIDIPAALAICEAATLGDWYCDALTMLSRAPRRRSLYVGQCEESYDANFCAAAHAGWPLALERLRECRDVLSRARDALLPFYDAEEIAAIDVLLASIKGEP